MNLFEIVKYGVSCREAAELYGVEVNRYSHILDEDRRHNATKFEQEFYSKLEPQAEEPLPGTSTAEQIMNLLSASPDVASELMRLLSAAGAKTAQTPKNVSK